MADSAGATIMINGREARFDGDPRRTLLDFLRFDLGLTGTKKGCDHGQCGACTVIVNGRRINACLSLAVMHDGDEVTTIEGLGSAENLWRAWHLRCCGCDRKRDLQRPRRARGTAHVDGSRLIGPVLTVANDHIHLFAKQDDEG
ncbi:MAG: hypothetical protein CFE33_20470 [Pseudorhodobacter sp. PARRP1]|nr:MAG: hypothetical protein CFE33_20470 [Pseudorhodobacter sp. PARRP1]